MLFIYTIRFYNIIVNFFKIVSRVPTIKKSFSRIHRIFDILKCSLRKRLQCYYSLGWLVLGHRVPMAWFVPLFPKLYLLSLCLRQFWLGQQNYEETRHGYLVARGMKQILQWVYKSDSPQVNVVASDMKHFFLSPSS